MNEHPLPQDVPVRNYALFRCQACSYHYAGNIPVIFVDLPTCPICRSASLIEDLLVAHDYNYTRRRFMD